MGKGIEGYGEKRKDIGKNGYGLLKVFLMLLLFLGGCKERGSKIICFDNLITENNQSILADSLKIAVTDSIKKWTKGGLKNTNGYLNENSIWKVDGILLNKEESRLFGWIVQVDRGLGVDDLDYVNYFSGEKRESDWYFYIHQMPGLFFNRKYNSGEKHSFSHLSNMAKLKMIDGGVIKSNCCEINNNYINEWVDREDRDMYSWHLNFLRSGRSE